MAEEIDDSGFYRQDFSTVSDWEVFTAQLGEVFQKLSISDVGCPDQVDTDVFRCNWDIRTELLLLHKAKISVSFYESCNSNLKREDSSKLSVNKYICEDLMTVKNTFGPPLVLKNLSSAHTISCMYGLRRFVLISPHQSHQHLSNPSDVCFFLSASTVVAAEYCPMVPIFVQIYDHKWSIFLGTAMHSTLRTSFDLVVLKQTPIECRYLSGLMTIFKEKLPTKCVQPITVSVRNTYALQIEQIRFPMKVPFLKPLYENDKDKSNDIVLYSNKFIALPCGYFPDAGTEIYLVYNWLEISENVAIDSPLHSDFVPSKSASCNMYQIAHAVSYLTSCLRDFYKLCYDKDTLESFVGRSITEYSNGTNMAKALRHLTDPQFHRSNSSNFFESSNFPKHPKKIAGPLNENELKEFLVFLFPDLYPDTAQYNYANDEKDKNNEFDPHRIKSAPLDCLSSRLSCLLATCNAHYGGKAGLAQLWASFTRELQFIWDVRLSIPGVVSGFPNTRTCLLNQKLEMLNYCIERSKFRKYDKEQREPKIIDNSFEEASSETGDEDDDEFYECTEYAPEGRGRCLGDLKLLDCDEPLYVPITQDPVPKTEDELQADAEAMLRLGSGSGLNMEMFSSLLSDMEAFKAANPKGKIEDFIRWYSPKDWEEDEQSTIGRLSVRMQVPGNTWQTVWQKAQPVPASKQKRLFDETTEAMKVLTFLETRNISEIYELTIIPLLHAALIKFKDILETANVLDIFETGIEALFAELCHLSRDVEIFDSGVEQKTPNPEHLIENLEKLETQFYQYKCFEQLAGYPACISLEEVKQKFREMIENENSCSITGLDRIAKHNYRFNEAETANLHLVNELRSNLIIKEYVLRVRGDIAFGPQFLRAIVTGEEVRLCGAFTENTTLL
ncbi:rab3 GTPase-activating protein catalytic subunit [Anastrepha obliqua]|uniref:rab3 GTPase-activating protein catalytic subunit n=1 Tax=Anastrepha obliqua TaxID=95512 RepID=UPI00240A52F9|nr:rab3 GTPase-activating protein catalytic subunit [Anastrepha obliqua]